MTGNLTQIERALLQEFESLAAAFADLAQQQLALSERFSKETAALANRQNKLETHLQQVSAALERQNRSTLALIAQAQTLSRL